MLRLKNLNKAYYSASVLHTFVIDAAEAIEYCHQCDIILANIRAKSFVVTDTCRLKLSDLGCARKLNGLSEMSIRKNFYLCTLIECSKKFILECFNRTIT